MSEIKNSGIEWIGEIPKEWDITNFGNVSEIFGRIGFRGYTTNDLVGKGDGPITLSPSNIIENKLSLDNCSYISWEKYEESPEIKIYKNDIILVKTASVGKCAIYNSEEPATLNPQLVVLKKIKCNSKYLYYQIISDIIQVPIMLDNFGSVIPTITQKNLKCYKIVFPPTAEQQKISAYLDTKCNKIDSIIEKQEKVIEKLKAYKLSVITEAVTKGLNPDVKMKDSGVEWIGEIPEHWKVSRIKYVTDFQPFCDTSHLSTDSIITYTPMENIKNGWYIPNTCEYGKLAKSLTQYCNGDIVMAKVTPCFENGNIAIMNNLSNGFGLGSSELFVFRSRNINTKYLFYWLRNNLFIKSACSTMTGTGGLKRISSYFTKNCYIHIPLANEQQQIADYLDKKCSAIDKSIEQKQAIIEKLKEYKKSLIYEVVTGKKEV